MIKKLWGILVSFWKSTPSWYSSELVAKLHVPEDTGYVWTTRRKLTPKELREWEEINEWAEKSNLPKTWSVKIEKVEEK